MNPTANSHYPATFIFDEDEPYEMAVRAVNVDLHYNRNPSNFAEYLKAAHIYKLAGRPDYSCELLERVALWILHDADYSPEDESAVQRETKNAHLAYLKFLYKDVSASCPAA